MQRWPHNARYAMVIYGMLWSAMVCYGTWKVPNMVPTRPIYSNHKSWSVIFRDQIQKDWTWRDHVGPRRTTSDLSQRELFGWHTPCELSTSILTGLTAQKTHAVQVKQCQTGAQQIPVVCMAAWSFHGKLWLWISVSPFADAKEVAALWKRMKSDIALDYQQETNRGCGLRCEPAGSTCTSYIVIHWTKTYKMFKMFKFLIRS